MVLRRFVCVLAFIIGFCGVANATPFAFRCITNNSATDCGIGEAQLWVDVLANGNSQVDFVFHNRGPQDSSITDVYFADGTLLGIAAIYNGSGVSFSQWATPGNLPGGKSIGFNTTSGFSADSDSPVQPNGVNPDDVLTIRFDLIGGKTYLDTLAALQDGSLRIGIHVQGFASGGSESFVAIPEPGSALLIGCGLALFGILARRKRR
jgi:hypothetical protein